MANGFAPKYDEFTDSDYYNKLIFAFCIVRIVLCSIYIVINSIQVYYEMRMLIRTKTTTSKYVSPRLFTFICLTLAPLARLIGTVFALQYHDISNRSYFFVISIWGAIFSFIEWIFVSCVWNQILFTYFISDEICFENARLIWKISCIAAGSICTFGIAVTIACVHGSEKLANLSGPVFGVFMLVTLGFIIFITLVKLGRQLRKKKSIIENDNKFLKVSRRIYRIAACMAIIILMVISRDVWLLLANYSPLSPMRHAGNFYQAVIDFSQMTLIMVGISHRPYNYLLFKPVNISKNSQSHSSSGSVGNSQNYNNNNNFSSGVMDSSSSNNNNHYSHSNNENQHLHSIELSSSQVATEDSQNNSTSEAI